MDLKMSLLNILFGVIFVIISMDSTKAQVKSRGDFCLGSTGLTRNHNNEDCDNSITNLICYEGKCACPEALTMPSANLPSNLNTWWHRNLGKCFAIKGSMCDLHPTKKRVDCVPGLKCIPNAKTPESGTCGSSAIKINTFILSLAPFVVFNYYFFVLGK